MSQAPVHKTTEGDRGGKHSARGHVSPLGGVSNRSSGDQSKRVENAQQPTHGYGGSKPEGMAG